MGALAGALPSILLALLLTSTPEALGANPGLVARITDKGLEYGKKPCLLAGLGKPRPQAALCTVETGSGDTDQTLSLGQCHLLGQAALAPILASLPTS